MNTPNITKTQAADKLQEIESALQSIAFYIGQQTQPEPADNDADFLTRFKENVLAEVRRDLQPEPVDEQLYCMVALKGEPAKRMLRTAAQELQRSLGDTAEWLTPHPFASATNDELSFVREGTYTYALKATIKLDGKMVTPKQAAADWEAKKETHELWYHSDTCDWVDWTLKQLNAVTHNHEEYELRPKALKIVKWADMPMGVMTNHGIFHGVFGDRGMVKRQGELPQYILIPELTLDPASKQPLIAVNGKFNKVEGLIYETKVDAGYGTSDGDIACFKITGIAKGYVLEGAV